MRWLTNIGTRVPSFEVKKRCVTTKSSGSNATCGVLTAVTAFAALSSRKMVVGRLKLEKAKWVSARGPPSNPLAVPIPGSGTTPAGRPSSP